jgi:hypothetical protein
MPCRILLAFLVLGKLGYKDSNLKIMDFVALR